MPDTAPSTIEDEIAARVRAARDRIDQGETLVREGRDELAAALADGSDEGLSYSVLGRIAGYTKQHAGELVQAARAAR